MKRITVDPKGERGLASVLLTDLYELTMACGYWRAGLADREAVFHLSFRQSPFEGGFTIAAGIEPAVEALAELKFSSSDLEYLASIPAGDNKRMFSKEFLGYLKRFRFRCNVEAVPEGTVVFPYEPLVRVEGPMLQAQLVETLLLNVINFQSLIATKAARVCLAAQGDRVIEFGLRRAQGVDGGLSASRAAYIGGCVATSNVLAGKLHKIPVSGTHAHSWVMAFESELEAFHQYAAAIPANPIFLVDTYDSMEGVRNAIRAGERLRKSGRDLAGIRLDSGDLAYLAIEARKALDAAGFREAVIVASNDLDEHIIASLKQQGAPIDVWGVGTRLVTAYDQPALGGVYKLGALRKENGKWEHKLKRSEQMAKSSIPGILQTRRFSSNGLFIGDGVYDTSRPVPRRFTIIHPVEIIRRKIFPRGSEGQDLLCSYMRDGRRVRKAESLAAIRERVARQLASLHPGIKRAVNPHVYPAGLEAGLYRLRTTMLLRSQKRAI